MNSQAVFSYWLREVLPIAMKEIKGVSCLWDYIIGEIFGAVKISYDALFHISVLL